MGADGCAAKSSSHQMKCVDRSCLFFAPSMKACSCSKSFFTRFSIDWELCPSFAPSYASPVIDEMEVLLEGAIRTCEQVLVDVEALGCCAVCGTFCRAYGRQTEVPTPVRKHTLLQWADESRRVRYQDKPPTASSTPDYFWTSYGWLYLLVAQGDIWYINGL